MPCTRRRLQRTEAAWTAATTPVVAAAPAAAAQAATGAARWPIKHGCPVTTPRTHALSLFEVAVCGVRVSGWSGRRVVAFQPGTYVLGCVWFCGFCAKDNSLMNAYS